MGEVLLVISGEILSDALSSALSASSTDSGKLSSWQRAKRAEERPPGIAGGTPLQRNKTNLARSQRLSQGNLLLVSQEFLLWLPVGRLHSHPVSNGHLPPLALLTATSSLMDFLFTDTAATLSCAAGNAAFKTPQNSSVI